MFKIYENCNRYLIIYYFLIQISKVLIHLLRHKLLFSFKNKFVECIRDLDYIQKDTIARILASITKLWPYNQQKTIVLLCVVIGLYNCCNNSQKNLLRSWIVEHLFKMFSNNDFQIAGESMNFFNRLLLENTDFWINRQDDVKALAEILKKVNYMGSHRL